MIKTAVLILAFMILFFSVRAEAQSCGFGCLGFSGVYGGYTYQNYDVSGINSFISNNSTLLGAKVKEARFTGGSGALLGVYFFRAKFDDIFFSFKGFYQFLSESHKISGTADGIGQIHQEYDLDFNYFGGGVDVGFPLFNFLDLKILEGGITFHRAEFTKLTILPDNSETKLIFENGDLEPGYYVGTGFVFHIIKGFISLETSAAYNFIDFNSMVESEGIIALIGDPNENQVEQGGIALSAQLNIGFPL